MPPGERKPLRFILIEPAPSVSSLTGFECIQNEFLLYFDLCRLLQAESSAKEDSQTSMHHENTSLRATISRQSQKIGRIENELRKNELLLKDQGDLQSTVEKQREKIVQYQREIEETKLHMVRLEELVHQVQEQSMKEHVTATPSVSMIEYPGIYETLVSPSIT